jgi:hypothetical protein
MCNNTCTKEMCQGGTILIYMGWYRLYELALNNPQNARFKVPLVANMKTTAYWDSETTQHCIPERCHLQSSKC